MEHLKMKLNSLLAKNNTQQMEDFVKLHQAKTYLGGGFTYVLFSPLLGEDSHFDEHIFQMGGSTTNWWK